MIRLKPGVRLRGIRAEMVMGHTIVASVFDDHGQDCVVTSANDSKHGRNSLHFSGSALDYRTHHLEEPVRTVIVRQLKDVLGVDFDVLLEGVGTPNEHIHVEYQPEKT